MPTKIWYNLTRFIFGGLLIVGLCSYPTLGQSKEETNGKKKAMMKAKADSYTEKEMAFDMLGKQKIRTNKGTGATEILDANQKWVPCTITPEGEIILPKGTKLLIKE